VSHSKQAKKNKMVLKIVITSSSGILKDKVRQSFAAFCLYLGGKIAFFGVSCICLV
jgi:hypothetical protein